MDSHVQTLKWATDYLVNHGYTIQSSPVTVLETPWSIVIRFSTSKGHFFLKKTPPSIPLESLIIQVLSERCHASVVEVVAVNNDLHCFLMKDAGQTLREYLKTDFQPDLLSEAIKQFTAMQRSTEAHLEDLLALGIPDWRLNTLPLHYENIINQAELLTAEGMSEQEIQILHDLRGQFSEQCAMLSQYQIPDTLVQPDCNTNNILIDLKTKKMTFIDLGETAITHPFFSFHNYLFQALKHHGVKEQDQIYNQLQEACFENWLGWATNQQLLEAFILSKKLWPIYGVLAYFRLMNCVDLQALKTFYADRRSGIAWGFREYIDSRWAIID